MKKSTLLFALCLIALLTNAQNTSTPSTQKTIKTDPVTIQVNLDENKHVRKLKNWLNGNTTTEQPATTQNQRTTPEPQPTTQPVTPTITTTTPARSQVNVDASFNGDWKMVVSPTEQLSKDGQRKDASGVHEIGVALKIQDSRISGDYTWAKGVCATAHLDGMMTGPNTFEAVVEYSGSCCGGTKMKINGQFTSAESFTAKFKPEGRPAAYCQSWWAGIQGIKE